MSEYDPGNNIGAFDDGGGGTMTVSPSGEVTQDDVHVGWISPSALTQVGQYGISIDLTTGIVTMNIGGVTTTVGAVNRGPRVYADGFTATVSVCANYNVAGTNQNGWNPAHNRGYIRLKGHCGTWRDPNYWNWYRNWLAAQAAINPSFGAEGPG